MKIKNMRKICIAALTILSICGCSKGADKNLETGKGIEGLQASLKEAARDMTQEEKEAITWALSDFDLTALDQKYPRATPRDIIRGEVKAVLDQAPAELKKLEAIKQKYDPVLDELRKIQASDAELTLPRDFHGIQPTFRTVITNNSRLPVSSLQWRASLYLDDEQKPVVSTKLYDNYNNQSSGTLGDLWGESKQEVAPGGLEPSATAQRKFTVGFVSGDAEWSTLEIQNAKKRLVRIVAMPASVKDYSDRYYLAGAPYEAIANLLAALETAKKYQHI